MYRRSFAVILVLALFCTMTLNAQIKTIPTLNKPAIVDINAAPEAEIVALGIDKPTARKIVEGRPYRNKREIVTRQFITSDQYDKLKDKIVAKQPKKG